MGHEATSRGGQQRGSAMGAHYRHTTPEMAARIATAIEQHLTVVLKVAEQALEAHPKPTQRAECSSATGPRAPFSGKSLAMTLRARVEDALRLVGLRGFEPLTPCMPLMRGWFTSPCAASPTQATEQVRSAVEGRVVGQCEAARSAVSGKSLARAPAGPSMERRRHRLGSS